MLQAQLAEIEAKVAAKRKAEFEETARRQAEAEAARGAAMERAGARAEAEERARREAAAEWARSAALESARAKAEEARMRRARYEAKAAEERVWAEAKVAEEQALRDAEQYEYEWRRKAQEEAEVAEAWREEQRQADARNAWGDAYNDAELRRGYRTANHPSEVEARKIEYGARNAAMDQLDLDAVRLRRDARQRVNIDHGLPTRAAESMFPTPPWPSGTPDPKLAASQMSPDHQARLLAAETAAAEAMASLARVQREVHGAVLLQ